MEIAPVPHRASRGEWRRLALGLCVLVPVVLLTRVPEALGAGWPVLVRTDVGLVAMAIVSLRLAIGAAHLAGWLGPRRRAVTTARPATLAA